MKRTLFTYSFKRVVSMIAVVVITLFMISKLSYLLENKTSYMNYASFFTKNEEYDVICAGTSHVRYGIYPMELWKDYGITSYNLASDATTFPVNYWVLRQAFHYHVPKVVVFDIYDNAPNSVVYTWEHVHDSVGVFPISLDKIRMVMDFSRNPEWTTRFEEPTMRRWDLIFKMAEFHERWAGLLQTDFDTYEMMVEQSEVRKGAKALTEIANREERIYPEVIEGQYDAISEEYLKKIIELCNEYRCRVILINTGYDCKEESKLFADSVPEIAKRYGIEYIDFTNMDLIDFACDLQSAGNNTHVNASGGVKLSRFIGDVLVNSYHMQDHREDASCAKWHNDYDRYVRYIEDTLRGISSFDEYIELLYGSDYDITIDIYDETILQEGFNEPMLVNLGVDVSGVMDGSEIKISKGAGVEYGLAADLDGSYRAKITVIDPKNQRTVDEKTF